MDIYVLINVLLTMHSWIQHTVLAVPAGVTPTALTGTPVKHVRTKRCSCATFLDKECVYFCHLDIIWVNTPERVVSYGLGSAPRTRRALTESMATGSGPRCRCFRQKDTTCRKFCRLEKPLRYGTLADTAIRKHELAADTGGSIKSNENRVSPQAIRTTLKTRLLLEKWKVRQRHRGRAQAPRDDR